LKRLISGWLFIVVVFFPAVVRAIDLGVSQVSIHDKALMSSLIYEHLKIEDNFDDRGRGFFHGDLVGARLAYGISDRWGIGIFGANVLDLREEAQGSRWKGDSGYSYGLDVYNDVFPATSVWPGVQLSAGVSGFRLPFSQLVSPSGATLIDQHMSGVDVHGSVIASAKWNRLSPYFGLRAFARSVDWHDDQPASGSPASIHGKAQGNVSVVMGVPVQLTTNLRLELESILVNQTALSAGLTWTTF
jgi:hypothetical protein